MKKYDDEINIDENGYYIGDTPETKEKEPKIHVFALLLIVLAIIAVCVMTFFTFHKSASYSGVNIIELVFYGISLSLTAYCYLDVYKKLKRHFTIVTKCTQLINAQCISVYPVVYKSGDTRIYTPIYKYIWNGMKYTGFAGKTEQKRLIGDVYPIFIDPSDPKTIYDPFAIREKNHAILINSAAKILSPLILFGIMVLCFRQL